MSRSVVVVEGTSRLGELDPVDGSRRIEVWCELLHRSFLLCKRISIVRHNRPIRRWRISSPRRSFPRPLLALSLPLPTISSALLTFRAQSTSPSPPPTPSYPLFTGTESRLTPSILANSSFLSPSISLSSVSQPSPQTPSEPYVPQTPLCASPGRGTPLSRARARHRLVLVWPSPGQVRGKARVGGCGWGRELLRGA